MTTLSEKRRREKKLWLCEACGRTLKIRRMHKAPHDGLLHSVSPDMWVDVTMSPKLASILRRSKEWNGFK